MRQHKPGNQDEHGQPANGHANDAPNAAGAAVGVEELAHGNVSYASMGGVLTVEDTVLDCANSQVL